MYMDFYERHINRHGISSLLEIGVQAGFSLKTWREWLPQNVEVAGWDILETPDIQGCTTLIVDQSDREQMAANIPISGYDVIIDDGGHTPRLMETSFSFLFPYCRTYIIEDLHAWWLGYAEDNDKTPTVDLLESIAQHGWLSNYANEQEANYVSKHALLAGVFFRGPRNNPDSMAAVIYNTEKLNA